MAAHSYLSASAAYRWLHCPGSVALCASMPNASSSYAKEGTAAHTVADMVLRQAKAPEFFLGQTITVEGEAFEVTEEMVEAVRRYTTATVETVQALPGSVLKVEHKFDLSWLGGLPIGGTCDAVIAQPFGKLVVRDLKYGEGIPVDPTWNPQLMIYGLGALGPDGDGYDEVELVIDQPRAADAPRSWNIKPDDLLAWGRETLQPLAQRAMEQNAPLNPEAERCRFCRAASVCPALRAEVARSAQVAFDPVVVAPTPTLPNPATLTAEQRRRVLDFADAIGGWVKAVKDSVYEDLKAGRVLPEEIGHKLVYGTGRRAWKDEDAVRHAFGALALEHKVRSPAQLEAALKEAGASAKEAKTRVSDFTQTNNPVVLAPITDKRPAINSAIDAFKEITG